MACSAAAFAQAEGAAATAAQPAPSEKKLSFFDPEDDKLDMNDFLLNHKSAPYVDLRGVQKGRYQDRNAVWPKSSCAGT